MARTSGGEAETSPPREFPARPRESGHTPPKLALSASPPLWYNPIVMVWPAFLRMRSACATVLVTAALLVSTLALAGTEAQFEKSCRLLKPLDVVSGPQLDQARRTEPDRPLQISGVVQGLMAVGDSRIIVLSLVDDSTAEIHFTGDLPEAKTGSRVRCLVKPADASGRSHLNLADITWDKTPMDVLLQAARAALKIPVKDKDEIARSAAELSRATAPLPSRQGDASLTFRRAIAYFNPRLSDRDINTIVDSILAYCSRYDVDPYLAVAVIAAESRFNPSARSYKGAAGLGQLMPATAAAHGVDPYDPIANLEVAIRIMSRNIKKYNNDWNKALAAYNAGTGAVSRYGGVPPYRETRTYLWRIYEYYCWLRGEKPVARPK